MLSVFPRIMGMLPGSLYTTDSSISGSMYENFAEVHRNVSRVGLGPAAERTDDAGRVCRHVG